MARLLPILIIASAIYVLYQIWIVENTTNQKKKNYCGLCLHSFSLLPLVFIIF